MKKIFAVVMIAATVFSLSACQISNVGFLSNKNKSYTIHFNANGGEGEMEDYSVEPGDEHWIPACTFTKEGYECVAWAREPEGENFASTIPNLTRKLPLSLKNGDTVELYAVWTTPGFTYSFSSMGWFGHWEIETYEGTAEHVVIPAWIRDSYNSGSATCHVNLLAANLFMGHTEIKTVENVVGGCYTANMFRDCTSLETVKLRKQSGVTAIGAGAFYNCTSLKSVELSSGLKTIGSEAFYMCTSMEKFVIATTLESLGERAFYGWTKEQTIEFTEYSENPFGEEAFSGCEATVIWSGGSLSEERSE